MVIKYTKSVLNHILPHNLTACKLKPPMYLFAVESFFFFFILDSQLKAIQHAFPLVWGRKALCISCVLETQCTMVVT